MIVAAMIIIAVNLIISILINIYTVNSILKIFKAEDKFDNKIVEHICNIYNIISYNGLVRPKEVEYDERGTSDNKERYKEV